MMKAIEALIYGFILFVVGGVPLIGGVLMILQDREAAKRYKKRGF